MQGSAYLGRTGFAQPDGLRPDYMGGPDLGFKDAQGVAARGGGDHKEDFPRLR